MATSTSVALKMLWMEFIILILWWQKGRFLKEKSAFFAEKIYAVLGQVLNKQVLPHHQEDPDLLFPSSKTSLNPFKPQSNFQWSQQGRRM